jgi:hypothetical protein
MRDKPPNGSQKMFDSLWSGLCCRGDRAGYVAGLVGQRAVLFGVVNRHNDAGCNGGKSRTPN